jgi:hypothetical protein
MKRAACILICALTLSLNADEGMWPFNQFPQDAVKQKHGFDASNAFLDNLRLASVRIGGGSGSFVSANGLVLTTQQATAGCLTKHDRVNDGFYAADASGELACADLQAGVLMNIEDVTKQVQAQQALPQRNAAIARMEKECAAKSNDVCNVVKLFSGGRYDLYRYKTYKDVRLVFAPEYALAFFGRERDSITYLRYGLNIAFLRVYENGKPAATPHFLKWSPEGVQNGELVVASANPGLTNRATTAAQLTFYRDTALPAALGRLQPRIQQVTAFAAKSEANRQAAQPAMTALLSSYKSAAGKLIGLRDDRLVMRKTVFEQKVRHAVERDPKLGMEGGKVWDQVAAAYKAWAPFEKPYQVLEGSPAVGSQLFHIARQIVRGETVDTDAVASDSVEIILLTQYLEELKVLGDKNAPVKAVLGGKTPQQAAEGYVTSSKLRDPAARRGATAKSDDGMIRLARVLDDAARKLGKKHDDVIGALETSAAEKIAGYRFQLFGAADYPDATSTPRVEFGIVKGYTDRAGVAAPYASTFSGLYYRRNNEGPYQVPQRWVDLKQTMMTSVTPMNFVSTCDIGGGDYGSATVNRAGQLVGVVFDGNLESLTNTYLYTDEQARAVHVAAQGIAEALEKVYRTAGLLHELGLSPVAVAPPHT